MMQRHLAVIAVVLTASTAAAQSDSLAKAPAITGDSPAQCMKRANDWRNQTFRDTPAATRTNDLYNTLLSEARRAAGTCGARFNADNTPSDQIASLIDFYTYLGDTTSARRTLALAMAKKDVTPRDRGRMLTLAMNQEVAAASGYFGWLEGAERYVREIDALPDSLSAIKAAAHQTMLGRYEYLDVARGLETHANALIALARAGHGDQLLMTAYSSLARSAADQLQPERAVKILDQAEAELGKTTGPSRFADLRHRYALIGTMAAPIKGQWWVNGGDSATAVQPGNGKVTIVEFTAHWCAPCRNSYPGMRSLAEHFKGKAFDAVLVTDLYGYIGAQRNLTPEQEVEADRHYYAKEHELPYRVAINPMLTRAPNPAGSRAQTPSEAYRVGGIPQIMIVDQQGIIRQVVIGWDQGNTERFRKYIEGLLAAK